MSSLLQFRIYVWENFPGLDSNLGHLEVIDAIYVIAKRVHFRPINVTNSIDDTIKELIAYMEVHKDEILQNLHLP